MLDADFIDDQTFNDTMESLQGDLETKADGLLMYVANLKAEEKALGDEIKRLQAKKKTKQNHQERLRNYLRDNMAAAGISKIECPLFTITLRKPSQVVEVDDLYAIPDVYVNVDIKPDKALIKEALKEGKIVDGCRLATGQPGLLIR
jgi:uncharacterized protein YeeX (DUF496 family)